MALCIARSLVNHRRFDPEDIADGSATGSGRNRSISVSCPTARSVEPPEANRGTKPDTTSERQAQRKNPGNGSPMCCAPYAIAYRNDPDRLLEVSRDSPELPTPTPGVRGVVCCSIACLPGSLRATTSRWKPQSPNSKRLSVRGSGRRRRGSCLREWRGRPRRTRESRIPRHDAASGPYYGVNAPTPEDAVVDSVMMMGIPTPSPH